ncbi:MAG: glycosyl hydrolase-related protein [Candidatus Omnitrophica bacterium]|nr:glycosyl hydrolase-related protein [Candidatus Omnitrophota bacterium]
MENKKIFLCFHHHSDLIWRRTKEGYNKVRQEQILYNLNLFRKYPEFRFCFAQSDIIKTFLKENPEYKREIEKLVKGKKIYFVGGIVSIPDTNLVSGESIVRNIYLGRKYYKENFNVDIEIAWFMDAFGMSGQIPQILKKSNFKYLFPGRIPGLPEKFGSDFLWEGIDGSRIITSFATGEITTNTHLCNLPIIYSPEERMENSIIEILNQDKENIFALYATEEGFFDEKIFSKIKSFKEIKIRQPIDYYQTIKEGNLPIYKGEFNPEFTGCYTTRIEIKRLNRKAENILTNCEKINSIANIVSNMDYDNEFFNNLWEKIAICQFHDGICGCHIDDVYTDMLNEFTEIIKKAYSKIYYCISKVVSRGTKSKIMLLNTNPWKRKDIVFLEGKNDIEIFDGGRKIKTQNYDNGTFFIANVPSFGYKFLNFKERKKEKEKVINKEKEIEKYKFENDNYKISVNDNELKIIPKFLKENVFDKNIFEIVFREDRGTLWTEDFYGLIMGREFEEERIRYIIEGDVFTNIKIEGEVKEIETGFEHYQLWDGFEKLTWNKEIFIFNELKYIILKLKLNWKGKNTKIFLSIPTKINPNKAKAIYEIPFGYIERKPYFEVEFKYKENMANFPKNILSTSKGDWPCLNWVYYYDEKIGLAVSNKGTPGQQLNNGKIIISLLRSPTEKASGFIPDIGSYDNGTHYYEFLILPLKPEKIDEVIKLSYNFINPVFSFIVKSDENVEKSFISIDTEGIVLSAFKMAENKSGYIMRIFESEGKEKKLSIKMNFKFKNIYETDLMENIINEVELNNIKIKPFEIKTFLIKI